ncbi:hypothetical protein RI543_002365 [Arxiozyma heterogenica]|uniref:RING-type E3 ubiquitin transferase n=1 Tax=Arxiozyma heterogenica TaxID=278026 RepID=A0AAN7WK71_9SACH|nr:hypothetical protein RI543_002365 [Kazachstania heterogenica]
MSANSINEDIFNPNNDSTSAPKEASTNVIPSNATCRICRGEATPDNPLFHPCECKGSIKYLHEPCLLEWISARNLDVNKPGSIIKCDICHYPFKFKTKYSDNMPDHIPISEIVKNSLLNCVAKIYSTLLIAISLNLFFFGIPLVWNFFGKCYTFMLDGQLPFHGQFWKSVLLGYREKYFFNNESFDYSFYSIILTLLENTKFSSIQIALIIILHLALYFQYDMIVREEVFSKMVFHKIGPNFSVEEMKNRLKATFPAMEDEMLDQVATMMRDRERREHEARLDEEERAYNRQFDIPEEEIEPITEHTNELPTGQQQQENEENNEQEEGGHDTEVNDPDYVIGDDNTTNSDVDTVDSEGDHNIDPNEIDHLQEERNQALRNVAEVAEENHNNNVFAEPLVRPVRPPQPLQQPRNANENIDAQEIINELQGNQNNIEQVAPFLININLKPTMVLVYTMAAVAIISIYILISYYIPSLLGYMLIYLYSSVISIFIRGLISLFHLTNCDSVFSLLFSKSPYFNNIAAWFNENLAHFVVKYYHGYVHNTLPTSLFVRSVPALTTYLTAIAMICTASTYVSKGYSRRNGMSNSTRRLIFQLLFAIRCTFKVFSLFFIELAGFPIIAGVMLDLSLISPILDSSTSWLWIPKMCWFWTKASIIVYWIIGTLYMYWFAKYIGMIRQYIIRPGVLFFIRSPDDPNIKILHDSLIHPMGIQLSRLCLSMFIYAIFILAGFGIHTRLIFPLLFANNFLNTYKPFSEVNFVNVLTMLTCFYLAKLIIENNRNVIVLVRKYWIKVFQVISRKSRLSSFILGKDYSLERGHILYRNYFYKFFAPKTAQWSNPDLFSNPKTETSAKQLFKENDMIHAYFIPDGMLMRVPSSDIVSRNYVQTMFVPVTKDDKLLKPLDLKKLKERNQKNAGEFAYLDQQNTEFDDYFVCYVPPNFKFRYISLIVLTWLFASLLIIGIAVASQYTFNTLTLVILPLLWVLRKKNELSSFITIILDNYKHANLQYVCLGAIILCLSVDYYQKHQLSKFFFHEHAIDPHDDQHAVNDEPIEPQANENQRNPLEIIQQSWIIRMIAASFMLFISRAVEIIYLCMVMYMCFFSIGYWLSRLNDYLATGKYNHLALDQVKVIDSGIQIVSFFVISYVILDTKPTAIGRLANQPISSIVRIVWRSKLKATLKSTLILGGFLILNMGGCVLSEYYLNQGVFNTLDDCMAFIKIHNFKTKDFMITHTTELHFTIISIVNSLFILRYLMTSLKIWFGKATQDVKDQVYASGRALENYDIQN